MKPQMRRNLSGTFLPQDLGKGAWRLTRGEAPDTDVFLRGAEPNATEALRGATVSDIAIEWRSDAVVLNFTSGDGLRTLQTQSAIVHEPQSQLYEVLPLASLDDKARRFWRRVFRLVRIPGGRYLLRVLARRTSDAG